MDFEWDEEKRLEVLRERRVDFRLMTQVFRDPDRFEGVDDRRDYGEERLVTIGKVADRYYVAVYVMRDNVCRT